MSDNPTAILSLRNLTRRFGKHAAVSDLSFDVNEGDIFGFLGPNGAGKSTTMYMITGLVRPTSGGINLFGRPHTDGPEARRKMGALVETPAFYEYLSGRKNLEILAKTQGDVDKTRVDLVLDKVGLLDRGKDAVAEYSHGMKQRLGIAQALLHQPRLLLLDEPTNGLDPEGGAQVWAMLHSLVKDDGLTVFVSSHLLHEVEENCNRIAVINQGILVACDYVRSLLFFNKEDHLMVFDTEKARDGAVAWLSNKTGIELLPGETVNPGAITGGDTSPWLLVRLRQGIGGEVVAGLAAHGCAPRAVIPQRKNLKQFFLELTRRQSA